MVNTGSVLVLTAFSSLQFAGTLAAPMFGVLGDRLGGRLVLCALRGAYAALASALLILAVTGALTPTWVLVVAALAGLVRPSDLVMRNALIGETIPPAHLVGALGLSRLTSDSARVAGALTGAGLSMALGLGPTYAAVTAFYLGSLALTLGVSRKRQLAPFTGLAPVGALSSSQWRDLRDGLAHVLTTPALLALMWLAFLVNLTAYPVSGGLLPYVAKNIYLVDATGLGWLVASFSLGGLVASAVMVATGGPRNPPRATLVGIGVWYVLLLGFAGAQRLGSGLLVLFAAGLAQNVAMISMMATLFGAAGAGFRGRVMGVRMLAVYGLPLGLMASGALIDWIGYARTVGGAAALGLVFTLLIGIWWRASLWSRRPGPAAAASVPERA
jgi:MFS family permease